VFCWGCFVGGGWFCWVFTGWGVGGLGVGGGGGWGWENPDVVSPTPPPPLGWTHSAQCFALRKKKNMRRKGNCGGEIIGSEGGWGGVPEKPSRGPQARGLVCGGTLVGGTPYKYPPRWGGKTNPPPPPVGGGEVGVWKKIEEKKTKNLRMFWGLDGGGGGGGLTHREIGSPAPRTGGLFWGGGGDRGPKKK